ncbi:hypothetical protein C2E23DRAFT_730888 [Lenzites betulinus]|nr:hypothetical protein C2E23DRAFT_730888 [Lenzites betulinus]
MTNFAKLSLFPATPEQVTESRKRTATQWAKGLSLEDYVQRDVIMDQYEHAAGGKLTTWVLAPRNDSTTLDFMCSCETFRRIAAVAKRSKDIDAREVRQVTAYGIASVFTPASKRGKGYARHMMCLLHWVVAKRSTLPAFPADWGTAPDVTVLRALGLANGHFSVLYSDIGPNFYQDAGPTPGAHDGWVVQGVHTTAKAVKPSALFHKPPHGVNVTVQRLAEPDVRALYELDAGWIKDDLARLAGDTDRALFSFLPNHGVGAFVIHRTMTIAGSPGGARRPVLPSTLWGIALLPQGTRTLQDALDVGEPISFVTWTLDLSAGEPRTLVVARLRADEHTMTVILHELMTIAREEKIERVEFWCLPPVLRAIAESRGWTTTERKEHLSAVKWYGEDSPSEVEWVNNEKYVMSASVACRGPEGERALDASKPGLTLNLDSAGVRRRGAARKMERLTGEAAILCTMQGRRDFEASQNYQLGLKRRKQHRLFCSNINRIEGTYARPGYKYIDVVIRQMTMLRERRP